MYAEQLAQIFHDNYERLAPEFGYSSRKTSAVPWNEVPEPNKSLMIATAKAVMRELGVEEGEGMPEDFSASSRRLPEEREEGEEVKE